MGPAQPWMDRHVKTIYILSSEHQTIRQHDDVWKFQGSGSCMNYCTTKLQYTTTCCSVYSVIRQHPVRAVLPSWAISSGLKSAMRSSFGGIGFDRAI
jgi:hypothetical protein